MVSPVTIPALRTDLVPEITEVQQEGFSAEFLHHFCETNDLDSVNRLDIQVDSATQNVDRLGGHLRCLQELRLTESSVLCIRDLGTELARLEILWMSRCGLQDLGGAASALPALRELYIPFNDVVDLSPLSGHEFIEVLDLEGNAVRESDEVSVLGLCPQLRELTLRGNPLYRAVPGPRRLVRGLLPQLTVLDDFPADCEDEGLLGGLDSPCSGLDSVRRDELRDDGEVEPVIPLQSSHPLLAKGLMERQVGSPYHGEPDEDELVVEGLKRARPKPAILNAFTARPTIGYPSFSMQPPDRRQVRTADSDPATFRPGSASGGGRLRFDDLRASQESASDLTCGLPLAGGPLTVVRQRRVQAGGESSREPDLGIRELLKRYRTYMQPSCIPSDELLSRRREAEGKRPGTPDVRIHTPASFQPAVTSRTPTSAAHGLSRGAYRERVGDLVSQSPHVEFRREGSREVPALESDATLVQPSLRTSFGETLFVDTETVVDLE